MTNSLPDELESKVSNIERYGSNFSSPKDSLKNLAGYNIPAMPIDTADLHPDAIGKELESRAINSEYGAALQDNITESQSILAETEVLTKEVSQEKLQVEATNILNGQLSGLDEGRRKLLKLKKRFPAVPSVQELPKSPFKRHPLTDSAWYTRLVPGIQYQVSDSDGLNIDIGPSIGYKVTDLLSAGVYSTIRFNFQKDQTPFVSLDAQKLLTGGIYLQHTIKNGFFSRASYEIVNSNIIIDPLESNTESDTYTGLRLGLGKEIPIAGQLRLYSMVEYNFNKSFYNPFRKQVQLRMGIYID